MSKYRNKRVKEDGYTFDSKAELKRYRELKLLVTAGEIEKLEIHPTYRLHFHNPQTGVKTQVCKYIADFAYDDTTTGKHVVEDVKGAKTRVYIIKKKMFEAEYGVPITEIAA